MSLASNQMIFLKYNLLLIKLHKNSYILTKIYHTLKLDNPNFFLSITLKIFEIFLFN